MFRVVTIGKRDWERPNFIISFECTRLFVTVHHASMTSFYWGKDPLDPCMVPCNIDLHEDGCTVTLMSLWPQNEHVYVTE